MSSGYENVMLSMLSPFMFIKRKVFPANQEIETVSSYTRCVVVCIVIAFIFLLFIIPNQSSYPFILRSRFKNNSQGQSPKLERLTSNTQQMINISYKNNQYFVFPDESSLVRAYLDVVRDTVCGLTLRNQERTVGASGLTDVRPFNLPNRLSGEDWPLIGITMVGQSRLINIEWALRHVIANGIPGDFIECGVWRGGSSVFARAVLKALNINDRHVWLADSFQGLPKPRTKNDNDVWSKMDYLRVSLEEVQSNFRSFDLLDDHIHFCKGYFVDSLPRCNVSRIAVLRMDGDMYESTMDQLFNLYSKVQSGGIIIVDDYTVPECQRAIHEFRSWHNITEEITMIPGDRAARYWVKKKMMKLQIDLYKPLLSSTIK